MRAIFRTWASGTIRLVLALCVSLAALTWLVFGQTLRSDFVNYDDDIYVYGNPRVTSGVTVDSVEWAFTHSHAHNWHPLTTISHLLDWQLYGQNPSGHHFTSVVLHTIAVLLLFLLLRKMTGSPPPAQRGLRPGGSSPRDESVRLADRTVNIWPSAFVAAVFAIHPLHVESVAWIAERKDLLSAVFFMLTLAAYVHYTRKQTLGRYVTMLVLLVCGLMSKPMLMTVPFVLLLLDYWPLKRVIDFRTLRMSAFEKVPLVPLSLASCVATISAQREAVGAMAQLPLSWRINNAFVSYITYIAKTLWPTKLAVFYPHPEDQLPRWEIFLAVGLLIGISAIAVALRKSRPYVLTGWFWYLGMLVPVIGLFQIGIQSHADRYTYLPQIGLVIAFTWAIVDLSTHWRYRKPALAIAATTILGASAACAWNQTSFWKNSGTLWKRALAVTPDNDLAHNNLGMFYEQSDNPDAAIPQYKSALQARYRVISPVVYYNLGNAFFRKGQLDQAVAYYEGALQLQPDLATAHHNLGVVLFHKGQIDEAIAHWRQALLIQPEYTEAHTSLGNAFLRKGSLREAIDHYEKAIAAPQPSLFALNTLAWILSTCPDASFRNGPRGVELARQAVQFSRGENSSFLRTLAAAYAEVGQFNDAIEVANVALQRANAQRETALANKLQQDVDLYRMNFPLRDRSLTNSQAAP